MVKKMLLTAVVLAGFVAVPRPAMAGCTIDAARIATAAAAKIDSFWYRWAAGLDCELDFTECVRDQAGRDVDACDDAPASTLLAIRAAAPARTQRPLGQAPTPSCAGASLAAVRPGHRRRSDRRTRGRSAGDVVWLLVGGQRSGPRRSRGARAPSVGR